MPTIARGATTGVNGAPVLGTTVVNGAGFPVDPAALTLEMRDPDGAVPAGFPLAIGDLIRDDLGVYHAVWTVPDDAATGTWAAVWGGSEDGAPLVGAELWLVVEAGSLIPPGFVTTDEVRVLVDTPLTDPQLEDVIARESAWLTRRIGLLDGERTEIAYPADCDRDKPLLLRRPTDAVVVTDDGTELAEATVRLVSDGTAIERTDGPWRGTVAIAYTPNDEAEVASALIELVRLVVTETGYVSERIGEYSYSRAGGSITPAQAVTSARELIVRDLRPRRGSGTIRTRSTMIGARVGPVQ